MPPKKNSCDQEEPEVKERHFTLSSIQVVQLPPAPTRHDTMIPLCLIDEDGDLLYIFQDSDNDYRVLNLLTGEEENKEYNLEALLDTYENATFVDLKIIPSYHIKA